MELSTIEAGALDTPFHEAFKHASAERDRSQSIIVKVRDEHGLTGNGEGCPREYVTGESMTSALAFVDEHRRCVMREVSDLVSLSAHARSHRAAIDRNPSAWCAIELAALDLLGRASGHSIEALLGLPALSAPHRYSAVLGDAAPARFAKHLQRYLDFGFGDFKIKLGGCFERDIAKVKAVRELAPAGVRVRFDANNLWSDREVAADYLERLGSDAFAVEEPLGVGQFEDLRWLSERLPMDIILDESLRTIADIDHLAPAPGRWILNLRVSKLGGLLRSLKISERAQDAGLRVIVGAHVGETSLLTRAGLTLASAAGTSLLAQEGAFGTWLLSEDVCSPSLRFGREGVLDPARFPTLAGSGSGLTVPSNLSFASQPL